MDLVGTCEHFRQTNRAEARGCTRTKMVLVCKTTRITDELLKYLLGKSQQAQAPFLKDDVLTGLDNLDGNELQLDRVCQTMAAF